MTRKQQKEVKGSMVDLTQELELTKFSDANEADVTDIIPTGLPNIDFIIGGGLPFSRLVEIYGINSSGKSTVAILVTGMAQKLNIDTAWVDVEKTTEVARMIACGVDPMKNLYHVRPEEPKPTAKPKPTDGILTVEAVGAKIIKIIEASAKSGRRLIIIWDSVGATPSNAEVEAGVGGKQLGLHAKAVTQFTTLIGQEITKSNALFIAINQARDKIGAFVPTIDSGGGNAFKHWASLRLEITKGSGIDTEKIDAFGRKENVKSMFEAGMKVVKSKVSTPNRKQSFILNTERGINLAENYFELASKPSKYNVIKKSGSWYVYTTDAGEDIKMYKDDWITYLDNPDTPDKQRIRSEIVQKMYMISFPDWYPALDNETIDIELNPDFAGLRARYEALHASRALEVTPQ